MRWRAGLGLLLGSALPMLVHCTPVEVSAPPRAAFDEIEAAEDAPAQQRAPATSRSHAVPETPPARSLLEFLGIGRGERIADVGSSPLELIARMADAVGPSGEVYARQDPRVLVAPARRGAATRREGTLPDNVIVMETSEGAPFSARARNLDLVTMLFAYHDLVARGRDRLAFNRAVFDALAPHGVYVIAEHAAAPGVGLAEVREGRVEERIIREDVEAAGFVFVEAAELSSGRSRPNALRAEPAHARVLLKFRRSQ